MRERGLAVNRFPATAGSFWVGDFSTGGVGNFQPALTAQMGPHIGDRSWRDVWILLSTMLDADDIILELKVAADLLVKSSGPIQNMLYTYSARADTVGGSRCADRVLHCGLEFARLATSEALESALESIRKADRSSKSGGVSDSTLGWAATESGGVAVEVSLGRSSDQSAELEYRLEVTFASIAAEMERLGGVLALSVDPGSVSNLQLDVAIWDALNRGTGLALGHEKGIHFPSELGLSVALHTALTLANRVDPSLGNDLQNFRMDFAKWSGGTWSPKPNKQSVGLLMEKLNLIALQHREIGHNWGLTGRDKLLLGQYYRANQLIFECISAAPGLTANTRQYVESTMCLPFEEIPPSPGA